MRKIMLSICSLLIVMYGSTQIVMDGHDKRDYYMNTITVEELKEHLYFLASDDFEGRETSKPGQKKAAAFLSRANCKPANGPTKATLKNTQQKLSFPALKAS